MHINYSSYTFGDIVYLKTDPEQMPRMVLSITFRPTGILYELGYGPDSSDHYDIEISSVKDEVIRLGLKEVEK